MSTATTWTLLQEKEGCTPNTLEFTIDKEELSATDALKFLMWLVEEYSIDDLSSSVVE
jgi:hypothetical protein